MKILYVVDYYQPQLGYSEYFIPQELKRKGHTVTILTSNYYYPFPNYDETAGKILGPRRQAAGAFKLDGIQVIKEPMRLEIFTRAIFGNHERHIQRLKPDLVIVNKSAGYNTIRIAQLKAKHGYRFLSYDAHLPSGFLAVGNQYAKEVFYWLFRTLFASLINTQADALVAVQEDTKIIMNRYYGQKNVIHIPLGTDTRRFYFDSQAGKKIRTKLGIKSRDFVVIYTGKIIKTKGVLLLFKALSLLWSRGLKIQLILVGNGNQKYMEKCYLQVPEAYHRFIHHIGFTQNKDLFRYYSAANVGVWPLEESTAMNDAAACELPFIANNTIGARVRLSNNNALVYKRGNVKDLARKIEYLYTHRSEAKKMGKRGKALIDSKLSWSRVVDEYLSHV